MSFRLRPRSPQGLRLLALLVLVIGLVAKPILVVACELDDLRLAPSSSEATHDVGGLRPTMKRTMRRLWTPPRGASQAR